MKDVISECRLIFEFIAFLYPRLSFSSAVYLSIGFSEKDRKALNTDAANIDVHKHPHKYTQKRDQIQPQMHKTSTHAPRCKNRV